MTINEAYQFVKLVYNKEQSGYITPDQFNNAASIMQMALINDRIGNVKKYRPHDPVPPYGFGMNQKIREELRPLLVKPTTTAISSGKFPFPADYLYCDTIAVSGKLATEVTEDQIVELNASLIRPPSTAFPKYVLHSDGIYVYPTSITSISLSYLRRPETPEWAYTLVNDEPVYDAGNSQDFETGETTHLEICMRILATFGLNLRMQEIVQYAEMAEATGK